MVGQLLETLKTMADFWLKLPAFRQLHGSRSHYCLSLKVKCAQSKLGLINDNLLLYLHRNFYFMETEERTFGGESLILNS